MAYAFIRQASVEKLVGEAMPPYLEKIAHDVERVAKATCPYDTGAMAASIESHLSGRLSVVVVAHTRYALWVHRGVPPHPITPRGFGYPLRFYWENRGVNFVGMRVSHPGQRAQPWLRMALLDVMGTA
jgi:hypothetical protein